MVPTALAGAVRRVDELWSDAEPVWRGTGVPKEYRRRFVLEHNVELQLLVLGLLADATDDRAAPAVIRLLEWDRANGREAAARAIAAFSLDVAAL